MEQKTLSVNDRSFRNIIEGNFLYADKTEYIYRMLNIDKFNCCFLSRPRRFGKSLLLDTIHELFQGDRKLFEGLCIDKSDYKFEKHPVLNFNMAYAKTPSPDILIGRIAEDIKYKADEQNVSITSNSYDMMLEQLLKGLSKKHGVGAVILVDEYDAPVTKNISDRKLALANRDILHDFFQTIKSNI
jgi:predicted AAA+ superfamily ATPase